MNDPGAGRLPRRQRSFVAIWLLGVVALYAFVGSVILAECRADGARAEATLRAYVESPTTDPNVALPAGWPVDPSSGSQDPVWVGTHLNRIVELSLQESRWSADFDVWFRWEAPDLDPGETFKLVNGTIEEKDQVAEALDGPVRYRRYRVRAELSRPFEVARVPLDDHVLPIRIELETNPLRPVRLVVDQESSGIDPTAAVAGYRTGRTLTTVKWAVTKSSLGDPRVAAGSASVRPQFIFAVWIHRDGLGLYVKLFQALFASVAIALLALCITPTQVDPRFGLPVGALFGAVANTYLGASLLPQASQVTLIDRVSGLGILTILMVLVHSAISLHLELTERGRFAQVLDRVGFVALALAYVTLNLAIPWVAIH